MEVKTIQDYYQKLFELYPTLPESDIKRIVLYGWKNFYLYSSYGTDILINRKGLWFYCGQLMNDSLKYFEYYKKKLSSKIRIFHARNHIPWDGYYYFALTKNQYDDYLNQKIKGEDQGRILHFPRLFSIKYTMIAIYLRVTGLQYLGYP